ncbi:MAG: UbiA family prenyltransferase [Burkholderiales bacterium]
MTTNPSENVVAASGDRVPLVVNLEGTLVRADLLLESIFVLMKKSPSQLFGLSGALATSPTWLRHQLAKQVVPDIAVLPYNQSLLAYLASEKQKGRALVLAADADEIVARKVADQIGLFDMVFASDGTMDLAGSRKRDLLVARFGERGYDFVGSDRADLPAWGSARKAIVVDPPPGLVNEVAKNTDIERVFAGRAGGVLDYLHALRVHHWLKNVLIFVPLAAAHQVHEVTLLADAMLAFVAFSLCASSVYLMNDLIDLSSDRRHPHKKDRPFASGQIPIAHGVGLIPLLLVGAGAIASQLPTGVLGALVLYCLTMLAYNLVLKNVPFLDGLVLAIGYALRVAAGAAAVEISASPWLLTVCLLLFFSLALLKRYAELVATRTRMGAIRSVRGYRSEQSNLVVTLGVACGLAAMVLLAVYTGIEQGHAPRHEFIWLFCVLLTQWSGYLWIAAHRGRIRSDPVAFALCDRVSQVQGITMFLALLISI